MSFQGQKIVVLGASGTLGSKLSIELASQGAVVIGTASAEKSLEKIPSQVTKKTIVDLTDSNSILNFTNEIAQDYPSLEGIVVASGVVGFGLIEEIDYILLKKMMDVNFIGPANLISQLFPFLKNHESEKAFVLGLTGVVVEQSFPGMFVYAASKSALSSFIQSIEKEWRRYKIKPLDVRLGHTETGLATRPLFGSAPSMPVGHSPEHAVDVIVNAITSESRIINSSDF